MYTRDEVTNGKDVVRKRRGRVGVETILRCFCDKALRMYRKYQCFL